VWKDGSEGQKGRSVVNVSNQSKHLPWSSVRMETFPEFDLDFEKGVRLISFDIKAGYRHFRLAAQMGD
jgi:hypothetical protein